MNIIQPAATAKRKARPFPTIAEPTARTLFGRRLVARLGLRPITADAIAALAGFTTEAR